MLKTNNSRGEVMLKSPFNNHAYSSDEADVVAINDDRTAALNRFRGLTRKVLTGTQVCQVLLKETQLNKQSQQTPENGGYINEGLVINEETHPDIKLPISDTPKVLQIAVDVRDVIFTYGFGKKSVLTLKKINLSVPQGRIYALLGSSGCGMYFIISKLISLLIYKEYA